MEPDPAQLLSLAEAGWTADDLGWERLSEWAIAAHLEGSAAEAQENWAAALRLARRAFSASDPRLAASLTNQAAALARTGDTRVSRALFDEAILAWDAAPAWVLTMRLEPVARSSAFHLRLELRHGDVYARRQRDSHLALVREAREATRALADGRSAQAPDLSRWYKNRPHGFTDTRKLLAAVALLASPAAGDQDGAA